MLAFLATLALAAPAPDPNLPDPTVYGDRHPSALGWHIVGGLGTGAALTGYGLIIASPPNAGFLAAGLIIAGSPLMALGVTGGTLRTLHVAGRTPVWPLLTGLGFAGAGIGLSMVTTEPAYAYIGVGGLTALAIPQIIANERTLARLRAQMPVTVAIGATPSRTPTLGLSGRW